MTRRRIVSGAASAAGRGSRAVFLDRDGVINEEVDYLGRPDQFHLLPGSAKAIRLLRKCGYRVVVVTNQSGLARGYFCVADLDSIHERMRCDLARARTRVDGIYICPHHPADGCSCRKPGGLLFQQAAQDLKLDLADSYYVGDKLTDLLPAVSLGGRTVLVLTGHGKRELELAGQQGFVPDYVAVDLYAAARWIVVSNEDPPRL